VVGAQARLRVLVQLSPTVLNRETWRICGLRSGERGESPRYIPFHIILANLGARARESSSGLADGLVFSSDLPRSSVRLTRGGEMRRVALDGKGRQNEWSWPRQASKPPGRPRGIENAYRGSSKRMSNVSGPPGERYLHTRT
jgi:hypothetical protein